MKNVFIIFMIFFLLMGCGGGGSSDELGNDIDDPNNPIGDPQPEDGPLAGTWNVTTNGITHTLTIWGPGPAYSAAWDTSNGCFTSQAGSARHNNTLFVIIAMGYNDNNQKYSTIQFTGDYDGEDALDGKFIGGEHSDCDLEELQPAVFIREE